jgi:hypothetical protein
VGIFRPLDRFAYSPEHATITAHRSTTTRPEGLGSLDRSYGLLA